MDGRNGLSVSVDTIATVHDISTILIKQYLLYIHIRTKMMEIHLDRLLSASYIHQLVIASWNPQLLSTLPDTMMSKGRCKISPILLLKRCVVVISLPGHSQLRSLPRSRGMLHSGIQ